MDTQDLKQKISHIEQCADDAMKAVQAAPNTPQQLRQCVDDLHQQARQAKKDGTGNEDALRDTVMRLEQTADRAMQACRSAAGAVDMGVQQAVQKAHDELSQLKRQVKAGSPV